MQRLHVHLHGYTVEKPSSLSHCWLGDRKNIQPTEKPVPFVSKGSDPEQVQEENWLGLANPDSPDERLLKRVATRLNFEGILQATSQSIVKCCLVLRCTFWCISSRLFLLHAILLWRGCVLLCGSLETSQLPSTRLPMPSSSATVTKKLSRRVIDDQKLSELQHIEAGLTSNDWKIRVMGIQQLQEFVISQPKVVVAAHITKVRLLTVKHRSIPWQILAALFRTGCHKSVNVIDFTLTALCWSHNTVLALMCNYWDFWWFMQWATKMTLKVFETIRNINHFWSFDSPEWPQVTGV